VLRFAAAPVFDGAQQRRRFGLAAVPHLEQHDRRWPPKPDRLRLEDLGSTAAALVVSKDALLA
jgi:hypothetical protein